ncbi:MAG: TolC family protein [Nitrospirota bacterium]
MNKQDTGYRIQDSGLRDGVFIILFTVYCLLLTVYLSPTSAYGQDNTQRKDNQKIVLNLEQCIKKAIEISPEIGESRYEEEVYKSKKLQADSAVYPQIEVLALTGPSPRARGDQVYSPDDSTRPTISGIFGIAEVTLTQPIYTFGKISSYKEAALSGTKVAKAGVDKKASDIILRTKELYWSLLLTRDIKNLVLEIKDELVTSIEKTERQLEAGSPWADELNLFKLRAFLGEVERNLNEAEKSEALAKNALTTSLGLPKGTEFDIAEASLSPEDKMPEDIKNYLKNATELRPEFIQLKEGLNAKKALLDTEKSNFYPQLFIGLSGSIADASNRNRVENPFIYDYFSHVYVAAYLGLKWSVDFGITQGKVKEAEAEYYKLLEKRRFADEAIPLQVRKAYLELEEARKSIPEMEKAYKNARKWLVAAIANFDLGIGEAKEIADAVMAYAQMKVNYLRTVYNHRMSFANLSYATGIDIKEVK